MRRMDAWTDVSLGSKLMVVSLGEPEAESIFFSQHKD